MGLLSGGLTFGGIFNLEIWWAYYPVGLLSGGLTYGILRYGIGRSQNLPKVRICPCPSFCTEDFKRLGHYNFLIFDSLL